MMKVCIAIEKFDPSRGGAERYCWDLAHYLVGRGHTVAVICMQAARPDAPMQILEVKPLRFPQGLRHLSFGFLHYRLAKTMPEYIHFGVGNTFFMDVYQPHGGLHRAWFTREKLRYSRLVRPLMLLAGRLSLKDFVQRSMEWWIFRRSQPLVLAISNMVAQDIQHAFNYPAQRIRLIANGIDRRKYKPENSSRRSVIRSDYGLGLDEFVFVFVAHNFSLKGFYVLVDACLSMEKRPFKVLIMGEPDFRVRCEARLVGNTFVLGGRSDALPYIYPACDCLVHPSYYDACSLVVAEALASGIPVITTSSNGAAMFVGENGRVVPPHDPQALAHAMREAYEGKLARPADMRFKDSAQVFQDIEMILSELGKA